MKGTLLVVFAHLLHVALTYPASDKIVGGWPATLGQYPYQVKYPVNNIARNEAFSLNKKEKKKKGRVVGLKAKFSNAQQRHPTRIDTIQSLFSFSFFLLFTGTPFSDLSRL